MADFRVRAFLKDDPETNLVEQIPVMGIVTDAVAPIPPETDEDVFARHLLEYFVTSGIIPEERRGDVVFDFA